MVERFDMMNESEVVQEITPELSWLKLEVKDEKEFEKLLQDPILQWATEKIFNQMSDKSFWKEREKLNNINIAKTLGQYEKKYPWLRLYAKILWLEKLDNFKDLTNEQKINFMALNKALKTEKTLEDVIRKTKELQEKYSEKMSIGLGRTHIKNFLQLKETLKDYWLNDNEIQKIQDLVNLINKSETIKNQLTEMMAKHLAVMYGPGRRRMCSVSVRLIVVAAVAMFWLWFMTHVLISKNKAKPRERMESFTRSTWMREILQRASYEDNESTTLKERTGIFEIDENAWLWERLWKWTANYVENKEIIMEVKWTVKAQFDLLNDGCNWIVNYDSETWKRRIDVYLPEPKLVTQDVSMQVLHESWRELVKIEERENMHWKMLDKWKDLLIQNAKDNQIIEKSKEEFGDSNSILCSGVVW